MKFTATRRYVYSVHATETFLEVEAETAEQAARMIEEGEWEADEFRIGDLIECDWTDDEIDFVDEEGNETTVDVTELEESEAQDA